MNNFSQSITTYIFNLLFTLLRILREFFLFEKNDLACLKERSNAMNGIRFFILDSNFNL